MRALTALAAMLSLGAAAPAGALTKGPDLPGHSPVARPGTPAAAKRALSLGELRDRLAGAMRVAGGASGAWVYDVDAGANPVLFTDDAAARRIPASNQKLFTTAAFLEKLDAKATLETQTFARGKLRGRKAPVLKGDLVLVGDGDPALATVRFARRHDQPVTRVGDLARQVARSGVRRITGRVLADDTIFDRERRAGPWLSPLSGLSFNNGYAGGGDYARAPELQAAKALKRALRKRGVRVGGRVGRANVPNRVLKRKTPLASVDSPPVDALIEETNVPSNNFFAEMLLKRVAAFGGKRGTRRRGARRVEAFAEEVAGGVRVADGSGLSRRNRASPEEVGKLLVAMAQRDQDAAAFRGSLPVAGREGTLADRMRGTAAEGACAAKTGTLSGVSALSGYCDAGSHTIAFSVLMNGVDVNAARNAQDQIAAAIARYRP